MDENLNICQEVQELYYSNRYNFYFSLYHAILILKRYFESDKRISLVYQGTMVPPFSMVDLVIKLEELTSLLDLTHERAFYYFVDHVLPNVPCSSCLLRPKKTCKKLRKHCLNFQHGIKVFLPKKKRVCYLYLENALYLICSLLRL